MGVQSGDRGHGKPLTEVLGRVFRTGKTKAYAWRIQQLKALQSMLVENEEAMLMAIMQDVKRTVMESNAEIVWVLRDINEAIRSLRSWMRPQRLSSPALVWPSNTEDRFEPLGVTLILSAFNAPLGTLLKPFVAAISAGNCAVLKPSDKTPLFEALLVEKFQKYMDMSCFRIVSGGQQVCTELLQERWDFICFTGSQAVAKIVMRAAAEHLTPTCIELGGKNPVIVDENAGDLDTLARRVISGRMLNAGQLCIGPDYVVCLEGEAEKFEKACLRALKQFCGDDIKGSGSMGGVINTETAKKVKGWLEKSAGRIICGGKVDVSDCWVEPTLIADEPLDSALMTFENFAPILCMHKPQRPCAMRPHTTDGQVKTVEEAIELVRKVSGTAPLALYVMSKRASFQEQCCAALPSGSACINDTVWHIFCGGFGGVGSSGHGKLGGKNGFETFSNKRTYVFKRLNFFDLPVRYAPFSKFDADFVRLLGPNLPDIPPLPLPPLQIATVLVAGIGVLAAAMQYQGQVLSA